MAPMAITICALLILLVSGVRILLRRVFSVLDNIPGPPRKSLVTGNLPQYHDPDDWDFQQELEENYGQVVKIHGLFGARRLFVFDPTALQSIIVKDQDLYEELPMFLCMHGLIFGNGILSAVGDDYRRHRKVMLPAFSTANLRGMVPLFYEVAERLDLNSIFSRTSLELIGRAGIGCSFDPMLPGQEQADQYARALRALIVTALKLVLGMPLLPLILKIPFSSFRHFMINLVPWPALHQLRDLVDFTHATAARLVSDRKAAITSGELDVKDDAKDIMSLLMKSNISAESGMHLTDEELVASISMIIFGATDTTSGALNRVFHMLTLYPAVQEKLRAEILVADEHLDHDALVALPYLDGVVRETLRLYPPAVPAVYREALEDTVLPLSTPIVGANGTPITTINVPKGTAIFLAVSAANHNTRVWGADAREFKPERWANGKAYGVTMKMCGIYGNTMTFMGGGRSCIGFKFLQLEMKAVVCVLLRVFQFSRPDARIRWRMTGGILSPHVDNHPGLPILVERLKLKHE